MKRRNKSAFTLVELIVVITILAILGTIAFISLQGYSKSSRDSVRISDVSNMKTSLELFQINAGKYPLPDSPEIVDYENETLWYQGTFGKIVVSSLSRNLSEIPKDTLSDKEYIYSVAGNKNEFQILNLLEGEIALAPINKANAVGTSTRIPRLDGQYNGVFIKTANYIVPVPSIITSENVTGGLTLDIDNIKSQIITGGKNIPNYGNIDYNTGALINLTLQATGTLDADSTDADKLSVYQAIYNTYSGTTLANDGVIEVILNQTTDDEKLAITDTIVLNETTTVANHIYGDWRDKDSNCDIADIPVGGQIWAGCNSTLGTGIEYNASNYCYNYLGTNTGLTSCYGFDTKENAYNATYGIYNIWGKLYTWDNSPSACANGYHVPSDNEWEILETTLNGGANCRNATDGRLCTGLGWSGHTGKNNTNNIIEALQLPLSGYRSTDGTTFSYRGHNTHLWSSAEYDATNARGRLLFWNHSTVYRYYRDKSYGCSVRCIKD